MYLRVLNWRRDICFYVYNAFKQRSLSEKVSREWHLWKVNKSQRDTTMSHYKQPLDGWLTISLEPSSREAQTALISRPNDCGGPLRWLGGKKNLQPSLRSWGWSLGPTGANRLRTFVIWPPREHFVQLWMLLCALSLSFSLCLSRALSHTMLT